MTEMPTGDMDIGGGSKMPGDEQSNQGLKDDKKKSADEQMVAKGADVALQANGIPPPASTMIGEKVGEAYTKVEEGMDPGKQIEKGLNTTFAAANVMSQGAQPQEAQDGMQAASNATKNNAANMATLAENPVKETLGTASQPTEKQEMQAKEGADAKASSSMKLGR